MPGKTSFSELWRQDSDFKNWLQGTQNKHEAYCTLCKKKFDISNGGIYNVCLHAKGKKHRELSEPLKTKIQLKLDFYQNCKPSVSSLPETESTNNVLPLKVETPILTTEPTSLSTTKTTNADSQLITSYGIKDEVTRAEIVWVLHKVTCHGSSRSDGNATDLFPIMFPDSVVARNMKLHKDKIGYVATFGLGPYFRIEMLRKIWQCDFYSVSFDESLNKVMKRCQLDLIIRFWDNESSEVKTNYLTSSFLTKATAINMKNAFVDAMSSLQLPLKKIVSISMDGPNVNKSMLRELKVHIKNENDEECPEIFDLGTCGLHVVHGAYKTAHNSTHWDIHAFLRALFYLFNDHPSRRGDYCFYSESELFPLKFCSVRWIENGAVIARAINILKNVKKYVEGVKDNPPNSTCFLKVQRFLVDDLLAAKLHFLQSIISDLEPFLTKYQSNKPLLPFLYEDLNHVLGVIGERLIKKDVFKTVKTSHQLQSVVKDEKNLKTVGAVDIGFGASSVLNQLKTLKDLEKLKFKQDCRNFLKSLIEKLCERSPGKLRMVKGASCFSPNVMTSEALRNFRIQIALEEFVDKKQMSPGVADIVKRSYGQLCKSQKVMLKEWDNESLDYFFMKLTLRAGIKDSHFFKFMQSILVMFHGNAEVERGFSVNKQCLCENMVEKSLISQRIICDAVSAAGGVTKINVTKNMILAVRNSSSLRREALSEAKKEAKQNLEKHQLAMELEELEKKRKIIEAQREEELQTVEYLIKEKTKKLKSV